MALGIILLERVLCTLVAINAVGCADKYMFKFGRPGAGKEVFKMDGYINMMSWNNEVPVDIPKGMKPTYVKVTLLAVSPPEVGFDDESGTVSINFDYSQISSSKYQIIAEAV